MLRTDSGLSGRRDLSPPTDDEVCHPKVNLRRRFHTHGNASGLHLPQYLWLPAA